MSPAIKRAVAKQLTQNIEILDKLLELVDSGTPESHYIHLHQAALRRQLHNQEIEQTAEKRGSL